MLATTTAAQCHRVSKTISEDRLHNMLAREKHKPNKKKRKPNTRHVQNEASLRLVGHHKTEAGKAATDEMGKVVQPHSQPSSR